ncbi:NUDIX domain-containing protein [Pseudonocardia sp. CA-107938]|uniref:NUDIX domain-containing protein n=1 Tax=Pseudonocardia sp. CA-107938 TaxID=3240021 RepID=UPI003D8C7A35
MILYCRACGSPFREPLANPRACACGVTDRDNPIARVAVLVPVENGVLVVRRGGAGGSGHLSLPGGFVETPQTWPEDAARGVCSETGLDLDPATLTLYDLVARDWRPAHAVLVAKAPPLVELPRFTPNEDIVERGIVYGSRARSRLLLDVDLTGIGDYFDARHLSGPSAFRPA